MENSQIRGLTGGTLRPQGDAGGPSVASDKTLPLRDVRILVADDDALSLEVTRLTLMSRGAQVDMAGSGLLAIEKTAAVPYDALLIDERMPSMLGSEAIKCIRARPEGDKICIVAMVSRSDAAAGERVIAAGANGWLAKPVSPRHLLETVIGCIGERKPHRAKQEQKQESRVAQAPQEFAELQSMDVGAAIARLGGNAGLYRQTLLAFVRSHTGGVSEIRTSLLQCDGALAHRQSHTLKGICGTIGAQDLFSKFQALENQISAGALQDALLESLDAIEPAFEKLVADVRRYAAAHAAADTRSALAPMRRDEVCAALTTIRTLLESDDANAARSIEKLAGRARMHFPDAAWDPFVAYGVAYEFDKALLALTALEASFNMTTPSGD